MAPDDWVTAGGRLLGPGFPVPIEPEEHAGEPCHAATVNGVGEVVYVCMEPDRHRPAPPTEPEVVREDQVAAAERPNLSVVPASPALSPEDEAAEAARRAEAEAQEAAAQARLEALQAAADARALALQTLLRGRLGRAELTRQFLNWFLLRLVVDTYYDDSFACQLLGLEQPSDVEGEEEEASWPVLDFAEKNDDSLQRAAVAVACQMAEELVRGEHPNFASPVVQVYYDYLGKTGVYELSDVERAELLAAGVEVPETVPEAAKEVRA
jgi:hypothetical protein